MTKSPAPRTLPALTIRQPWVHAIMHMGKDVENRSWQTAYRGPLLVHAGKGLTKAEYADFADMVAHSDSVAILKARGVAPVVPPMDDLPRAGLVGIVDVVDCVADSESPWFSGPFALVLANPRPIPFVSYRGQLGMFKVPVSVLPENVSALAA